MPAVAAGAAAAAALSMAAPHADVRAHARPDAAALRLAAYRVAGANIADAMDRTVSRGFGRAPQGGAWLTTPATRFSVRSGTGAIAGVSAGAPAAAVLSGTNILDERVTATFALPSLPTGDQVVLVGLGLRRQANGDIYRLRVRVTSHGTVFVRLLRRQGGVSSVLGPRGVMTGRLTPGRAFVVQAQIAGSGSAPVSIAARAWLRDASVPGWQTRASDAGGRLARAGRLTLWADAAGSGGAHTVRVLDVHGAPLVKTAPPAAASATPTAATTGVPAGTRLKAVYGTLTITRPGVYSGLDVHGFVVVKADDVTLTRSIVRGGSSSRSTGLITNLDGRRNLLVSYTTLLPAHPSVMLDGVMGRNYTLDRVEIQGTVDGAKIFGDNVTITNSWIHGLHHYASDPYQNGGPSHNDDVQVLGGHHLTIANNVLTDSSNAALQVTQTLKSVSDLRFTGNWAGNGACTLNLQDAPLSAMSGITLAYNHFADTSTYHCPVVAYPGVSFTNTSNVFTNGRPITVVRK